MLERLAPWRAWIGYCLDAGIVPVCDSFWQTIVLGCIALASVVAAIVIRRLWLDHRRRRAADRAEWEKTQIDYGEIEAHRWRGDDADNHAEADLAERIRQALAERKAGQQQASASDRPLA